MKKLFAIILSLILIFTAAGCAAEDIEETEPSSSVLNPSTHPTAETTEPQVFQTPMAAVAVPSTTEQLTADDGTVLFEYTYQTMSLVLPDPDVAHKVIVDFLNRVDQTRTDADTVAQMAENYYTGQSNWVPYLYHLTYSPMRIDHGVLSLFGTNAVFSGAGHPDRTCVSASYDLVTGDVLTLGSIMDPNATTQDFCDLVLEYLAEIADRNYLYKDYANTVKQRFAIDESQNQDWFFSQTGLCFYFAPYEIAPYSSGVITVEIPYEKLDGLLYESYFPPERENATGNIRTALFESVELRQFSQIAEVIQSNDGPMYFVYSDRSVQDIRILISDAASSYTIFAAYGLTPGDAVMVQADKNVLETIRVSFKSNEETLTVPLISE